MELVLAVVVKSVMQTNFISAFLAILMLASPLWAGQYQSGRGVYGRPPVAGRQGQFRPQSFRPQSIAPRSAAVPRSAPPAQFQSQVTRPPAVPHQIIRGEGPHNGDWLRNTMRLPPQEQQRRLEQDQHFRQLPQQRQQQLRERLQKFNAMQPQQQQRVLNRMEMIEHLRPEQQRQAVALFGQFRAMDPQRKEQMRSTLRQMRTMTPDARERMMNSPDTRARYSPQEIQMLHGFNDIGFAGP